MSAPVVLKQLPSPGVPRRACLPSPVGRARPRAPQHGMALVRPSRHGTVWPSLVGGQAFQGMGTVALLLRRRPVDQPLPVVPQGLVGGSVEISAQQVRQGQAFRVGERQTPGSRGKGPGPHSPASSPACTNGTPPQGVGRRTRPSLAVSRGGAPGQAPGAGAESGKTSSAPECHGPGAGQERQAQGGQGPAQGSPRGSGGDGSQDRDPRGGSGEVGPRRAGPLPRDSGCRGPRDPSGEATPVVGTQTPVQARPQTEPLHGDLKTLLGALQAFVDSGAQPRKKARGNQDEDGDVSMDFPSQYACSDL